MVQKMLLCFKNISAEVLMHILGYGLRTACHILAHLNQMLLQLKHQKFSAKKLPRFGTNNVGEIDPRGLFNRHLPLAEK
jgi:hypothetical protein